MDACIPIHPLLQARLKAALIAWLYSVRGRSYEGKYRIDAPSFNLPELPAEAAALVARLDMPPAVAAGRVLFVARSGSYMYDLATARIILPGLTRAAVERYADTASIVFNQCVREYRDLAAQADQLANDRQTLIDAWPR